MSLRVLLADESSSIKKAFELALKDFAVAVQTVQQGTDILELFNSFQPDICFFDVLLPKKNGYEACTDIKQNGKADIPIVLMWSNFMKIDESKFEDCGAEAKIEKPFETKTLRSIVMEHVPKVKQNKISAFLEPIAQEEYPPDAPNDPNLDSPNPNSPNDSNLDSPNLDDPNLDSPNDSNLDDPNDPNDPNSQTGIPALKDNILQAQDHDVVTPLPDLPNINSILDDPPSKDSPSKGSPSKGSPSEGSPSKGSPSKGSPSEGSPSEGSPSEGSPSKGSPSKGSPSEGSPSDDNNDAKKNLPLNNSNTIEKSDSEVPAGLGDDPFSDLGLQDSDSENDDLESFQMEPLESFETEEEDRGFSGDTLSSSMDLTSDVPPFDPLSSGAFKDLDNQDSQKNQKSQDNQDSQKNQKSQDNQDNQIEDDDITDPSVSTAVYKVPPSPSSLEEPDGLLNQDQTQDTHGFSSDKDITNTEPSTLGASYGVPPLPNDVGEENKHFTSEDDEVTAPSVSVADGPIISPPSPPHSPPSPPYSPPSPPYSPPSPPYSPPPPPPHSSPPQSPSANESNNANEAVGSNANEAVGSSEQTSQNLGKSKDLNIDLDSQLSKEELKRLIMAQSKDIIESIVWEVVPELAKEMIKKEIERLTGELNSNKEAQ